jgi:hypothetical protein
MTRDLSATNEAAAQANVIAPVLFLDLGFDSGTVRVHSWTGSITWGGNTYSGVGQFGQVTPVEEDSELSRTPITLTLSGIPLDGEDSELISAVLNEHYQGRTATLYLGYLDTDTLQLQDDPFILYRGRIDVPDIDDDETLTVSISVESRFAAWDRPNISRYNNADQQSRYPGDLGLQYVEQSTEKQIAWGTQLKT